MESPASIVGQKPIEYTKGAGAKRIGGNGDPPSPSCGGLRRTGWTGWTGEGMSRQDLQDGQDWPPAAAGQGMTGGGAGPTQGEARGGRGKPEPPAAAQAPEPTAWGEASGGMSGGGAGPTQGVDGVDGGSQSGSKLPQSKAAAKRRRGRRKEAPGSGDSGACDRGGLGVRGAQPGVIWRGAWRGSRCRTCSRRTSRFCRP